MIRLLFITVLVWATDHYDLADAHCDLIEDKVKWERITYGSKSSMIAVNSQNDALWIITTKSHEITDGYYIAKFNNATKRWDVDESQPVGASGSYYNSITVDPQGNPAFLDTSRHIHRKKNGWWMKMEGCAKRITFGGDGSFFKADCKGYVFKYDEDVDSWDPIGHRKSFSIAVDDQGVPWIVSNPKKVFRWDDELKRWSEMGVDKAYFVAAGKSDQVYVIAEPRRDDDHTVYRYLSRRWVKLPGKTAEEIAVGPDGRIFITVDDNKIFESKTFGEKWD